MFQRSTLTLLASTVLFLNQSTAIMCSPVTPEMRSNAEKAIQTCEQTYKNTQQLKARFDKVKKPTIFSSKKAKMIYQNLPLNKKTFEMQMAEFSNFTNEKIKIRGETTVEKLRDSVIAYSSNCARFATGLAGFVEWATTGKGPEGFDRTYQWWQDETRKTMPQ